MEEPDTRIIGFEAYDNVAIGRYYNDIAFCWNAGERIFIAVPGSGAPSDNLKDVALFT
jgi:hypothetical protein